MHREIDIVERRQALHGRDVQLVASASTRSPSSGSGGPLAFKVLNGAFTAMTRRSSVPAERWSLNQSRTFGETKTGHSRFRAPAAMRVPATPAVRRNSPEE